VALLTLDRAARQLDQVYLMVHADSFAVIDVGVWLLLHGKHRPAVFRYALLVNRGTGGLEPLLWGVERNDQGENIGLVGDIQWLPRSKVQECLLHVDGKEIGFLGRPSETALAMVRVHQGQKQLPIPDDLKPLAMQDRFTQETAAALEKRLREVFRAAAK
jgi:hypothetical protein